MTPTQSRRLRCVGAAGGPDGTAGQAALKNMLLRTQEATSMRVLLSRYADAVADEREKEKEAEKLQNAAAKRQRSREAAEEERRKRQERLAARQPQQRVRRKEPEVTNAVRPEPALDVSDDAPSIEAQLLARQTFSLHVKNADEAGVVILW